MNEPTLLKWQRKSPNSSNNFDLIAINPEAVDVQALTQILNSIEEVRHRRQTLNSAATQAFRDWLAGPSEPLRSLAYVSLSNWFCTAGGDRHSEVANRCERLWDALFLCRPLDRLSSSERAKNRKVLPEEFERFWPRLSAAQDGDSSSDGWSAISPRNSSSVRTGRGSDGTAAGYLRATFVKAGMRCELEGDPQAIAQFMQIVSNWEETTGRQP